MTSTWHSSDIPEGDLLKDAILQNSAYFKVTSTSLALVEQEKEKGWERVHAPSWLEKLGTKIGEAVDKVRGVSHPEVFFLCAGAAMGLAASELIPQQAAFLKYLILAGVPNISLLTTFGTRIAREEAIALRMALDETGAPSELQKLDRDLYAAMRDERKEAVEEYPDRERIIQKRGAILGEIGTGTLYTWIGTTAACAVDAIVKKGGGIIPVVDIAVCLVAAAEAAYFFHVLKENKKALSARESTEAWKFSHSQEYAELLVEAKREGRDKKWVREAVRRKAEETYRENER